LAVKGNHDPAGPFPPPIIDVHLRVVTLTNGFRVGGFNGCCRYKPRGHFLYDQDEAVRLLRQLPAVDLLVAHNSPLGVHEIDDDVHQGFLALSEYIQRHSPQLLVHGHQHVARETTIDRTRVVGVFGHAFLDV
jgi:Icc-related predicted phosphoesterase